MILRAVICVLSLADLADALYFTFAYYGRIKKARWVPEILCAREGSSCVTVVQTPYARVFGVPNSLLGIVYYILVIAWAMQNRSSGIKVRVHPIEYVVPVGMAVLILISAGTIVLGFYLIYSLRRKLHIDCPLCYTAHAINAALFVLLVILAS
jgi:uncharacterized membrane protein